MIGPMPGTVFLPDLAMIEQQDCSMLDWTSVAAVSVAGGSSHDTIIMGNGQGDTVTIGSDSISAKSAASWSDVAVCANAASSLSRPPPRAVHRSLFYNLFGGFRLQFGDSGLNVAICCQAGGVAKQGPNCKNASCA
jgi:hypothetical protein